MTPEATFFAVCNSRYFPSLIALLNSLRLTGHAERLVVGDCGLTDEQRVRLAPHCEVFPIPMTTTRDPVLWKPFPRHLKPTGVVVIIDSDMIVTGSMDRIIADAAAGRICAYPDPSSDRRFAEWQSIFSLPSPPRQQPFITASFVVFSADRWPNLLDEWWAACDRIPAGRTLAQGAAYEEPLSNGDQDALNAVLMSVYPADALEPLPVDQRPVWRNEWVRVVDAATLACTYRGTSTLLLHADGIQKPWERPAWWRIQKDAYVLLMRRLFHGPGLTMQPRADEIPLWLRDGRLAGLTLSTMNVIHKAPAGVMRIPAAAKIKRRLIARLEHRASLGRAE